MEGQDRPNINTRTTDDNQLEIWNLCYERQYSQEEFMLHLFGSKEISEMEQVEKMQTLLENLELHDKEEYIFSPSLIKNILPNRCAVCNQEAKSPSASLSRCTGCKFMYLVDIVEYLTCSYYCSREHQRENWSKHKGVCNQLSTM